MIRGIDVSSHQGVIDWAAVANDPQQIRMASTKVTGGYYYVNPTMQANADGMKAHGLFRDFYHYAFEGSQPDIGSPKKEAEWFLKYLPDLEPHDMVSLDLEEGSGPLGDWALEWLRYVQDRVGFAPALYTSAGFIDAHFLPSVPILGGYPLWLAAWRKMLPAPPAPWELVAWWQDSSSGHVQGIAGDVDMDWFNGTVEQRKMYGFHGADTAEPVKAADTFSVGTGLREMMAQDGTVPLMSSAWAGVDSSAGTSLEWCPGTNSVIYYWHNPDGHHWRVKPS